MPEFILESSGRVDMPAAPIAFTDLDSFTQGYIECLFFTNECVQVDTEEFRTADFQADMVEGRSDGVLPGDIGFADLAPEALAEIMRDCARFQEVNAATLESAYAREYEPEQAGRDFWFTRNGHGVGFWDRKPLECDSPEYETLTDEMVAAGAHTAAWQAALDKRNAIEGESLGAKLSAACGWKTEFGERDVYFGDDSKVYFG